METGKLHLEVLRRSRKPVTAGDCFAIFVKARGYFFGHVIIPSLPESHPLTSEACLIYVYGQLAQQILPFPEGLGPHDLLLPPLFTNRQPWRQGFFQNVAHSPLGERDLLPRHCFYDILFDGYVDEMGRRLPEKTEPCGDFGVMSYSSISSALGDVLGLPRLETEEDY
ncbi:Imm26 family immunity protein [Nonomuraea turcica]|uniref:Imm26 family immunity protein n=1 Tax=Nonomuraea sp. G32 TaxID=3067274 RepID=UPI00353034FE